MNFSTGVIFGAFVGFALGLLFAPQSGQETRSMLNDQGIAFDTSGFSLNLDFGDQILSRATAAIAQGAEVYQMAKNELSGIYEAR